VAGLAFAGDAPGGAVPARFMAMAPAPGTWLRVFGYPGDPPRPGGAFVDVDVKGQVTGRMLQVESRGTQTIKAQPGFSGSPVWDPVTGEAAGLLQLAPQADQPQRDAYLLPPEAVAAAWEDPFDYLLVPDNPYRGLEPFTAAHASVFFGREDDIAMLAERVRAQPVIVVVGPSGVGKSSLVRAGLIPALGESWSVVLVRPGQDPWLRLAAGLLRAQYGADAPLTPAACQEEISRLRAGGLRLLAEFLRSQDRRLLVVVDQFEEALAGEDGPDPELLDLLLPQARMTAAAARVVLTLRADYQSALQSIPGFHERLNDRLYLLSPLTSQQMNEAVQRPATVRGVSFEPGLADQIVADAAGGALPVLEFTLTRLWQAQRRKTLTFTGYHGMGGVRGALDRFAEQQAAELGDTAAGLLDRVLLRLVRVPVGSPELATRQRARKAQIPVAEWQVLRRLAAARLVVQDINPADGEAYAELAHETLITAWRRLSDLVAENSEFLAWLDWVQQRVDDSDPLPEERIPQARHWADTRPDNIPPAVAAFIRDSETAIETRLRELREARDLAEAAREQAEAATRRAEALRLAAAAELALQGTYMPMTVSLALSTESVLTQPTLQGDIALRHVLHRHPATVARLDHGEPVVAVAFSPDGTRIATASCDWLRSGSARVIDAATGAEIWRLDGYGAVGAVAFSPDGTRIATASGSYGGARVIDAATGAEIWRLDHRDPVRAVAFSPDGTRIATASGGRFEGKRRGGARVIDAATGAQISQLDHDAPVNAVAFSPDGTRIATASDRQWGGPRGGGARVIDAATGAEIWHLDHDHNVYAVAFSPDGTRIATASSSSGVLGGARVIDAATGAEILRVEHDAPVNAVAFSPDGTRIATATGDRKRRPGGSARVIDAATGAEISRLDQDDSVNAVAFSPDGTRIAIATGDLYGKPHGGASVIDAVTRAEAWRVEHDAPVNAVAFSPGGTRIATAIGDLYRTRGGGSWLIDASTGAKVWQLRLKGTVNVVAFSPDGTRIATGSTSRPFGGETRVINAATGAKVWRLGHYDPVRVVAFSPDGTRIAAGGPVAFGPDGTRIATSGNTQVIDAATGAEIWRPRHESRDRSQIATRGDTRVIDAATGVEIWRLRNQDTVNAVAFSPDGTWIATATGQTVDWLRGGVQVIDAATGTEIWRLDHDREVCAVTFSPDGTRVATATRGPLGDGGGTRVIDAATGAQIWQLDHDDSVNAVAFSPDGTRIATGTGAPLGSGGARVIEAATGAEISRLDHDAPVNAVAFSPDGTRIATASSDRSLRVWCLDHSQLIEQAMGRLTRNLTRQEWSRYFHDAPFRKTRSDFS
jgi:WD40 repeat protein